MSTKGTAPLALLSADAGEDRRPGAEKLRLQKTLDLWRGPRRRDKDDGLTSEDVRRLGDDELIAYVERRQREAFEFTCDGAFQFQIFFRQGRALLAWIFEHWYDGEDPSVQIGIATVIDRRAPGEIGKRGRLDLTRHRVRDHHLPLVDVVSDPAKWDPAEVSRPDFPVLGYQQILADGADRLAVLLRTVVEPGAMPAVFHCIAGKERTGLVAAVILRLLGVPQPEVAAEYALSEGRNRHSSASAELKQRYPHTFSGLHATPWWVCFPAWRSPTARWRATWHPSASVPISSSGSDAPSSPEVGKPDSGQIR